MERKAGRHYDHRTMTWAYADGSSVRTQEHYYERESLWHEMLMWQELEGELSEKAATARLKLLSLMTQQP
mgnify:CR=1 FL=1